MDRQNLFNQPVKNSIRTSGSICKTVTGQGDDYAPVVYRIIPISKSKDGSENTTLFITEEAKEVFLDFLLRTTRVL